MNLRVPFQRPLMPPMEEVSRYFDKSIGEGFFSNGGPCATMLEERLAERLGVAHVVLVNNATSGLMVAADAVFGRGARPMSSGEPRGIVLVPSFTFAATVTSLLSMGFLPCLIDIDLETLQVDPDSLAEGLDRWGSNVCGALLTSTFGIAAPEGISNAWERLCSDAGIPTLFDSAAGFGSVDDSGRILGSSGRTEVFSFHATKPFAVGEGGCVVTNDAHVAAEMRRLINFGFGPDRVVHGTPGINGKMPEILCAIGLAVLDSFDTVIARRQDNARAMTSQLTTSLGIPPGLLRSAVQFVPALVDPTKRDRLVDTAEKRGVGLRTYFDPPIHRMPGFAQLQHLALPATETASLMSVSLPMSNAISASDIAYVASVVNECLCA